MAGEALLCSDLQRGRGTRKRSEAPDANAGSAVTNPATGGPARTPVTRGSVHL